MSSEALAEPQRRRRKLSGLLGCYIRLINSNEDSSKCISPIAPSLYIPNVITFISSLPAQIDNVGLLERYSSRRNAVGALYLTATHLIYVDHENKRETWVSNYWAPSFSLCLSLVTNEKLSQEMENLYYCHRVIFHCKGDVGIYLFVVFVFRLCRSSTHIYQT